MKTLSVEYPDMWFEIYGQGEDPEDWWRAIYHNGKMTKSRGSIEYEPYCYAEFDEDGDTDECPF